MWCAVNAQNDNICYTEYTYGDIGPITAVLAGLIFHLRAQELHHNIALPRRLLHADQIQYYVCRRSESV